MDSATTVQAAKETLESAYGPRKHTLSLVTHWPHGVGVCAAAYQLLERVY